MSHFTVLVVLPRKPTEENKLLSKALQPFHEYECTDVLDEHVVFVDEHTEVLKEFEAETEYWRTPCTDECFQGYEDQFYREPNAKEKDIVGMGTGCGGGISWSSRDWGDSKGYRAKVRMDDHEIRSLLGYERFKTTKGAAYDSLLDYAEKYHGYTEVQNGRIGRMTNPNAKWDWWEVGGRWGGQLLAKKPEEAFKGEAGIMGSQFDEKGFDGMCVSNLDLEAMRKQKADRALNGIISSINEKGLSYDEALKLWLNYIDNKKSIEKQWDDLPEDDRPAYRNWITEQGEGNAVFDARESGILDAWGCWGESLPDTVRDPIAYAAARPALTCWAYLEDGVWNEKGSMGWFGMSSDNKDAAEWEDAITKRIEGLPDSYWVVMVDCHI